MNEDVLSTRRSLRRRRHLPRNRPDEARELTRDRGGDLGLGLPARDQAAEASRETELRLPREITHDFGQRLLPIRVLATNAGNPLIRSRRFGE